MTIKGYCIWSNLIDNQDIIASPFVHQDVSKESRYRYNKMSDHQFAILVSE